MPVYTYHCSKCDKDFDEMWRSVEDFSWPCPGCGTNSKRVICSGSPAIVGETVGKGQPGEVWRG